MMQDLGRRYVRIFNDVHHRTGTLWEGRYKAAMIDTERYLLTCHRYIELNPVRAGLVPQPADFRWSSHRFYVHGFTNALITPHSIMQRLGVDDAARRAAYLELFKAPIEPALVDLIRSNTNKGWPLGSKEFLLTLGAALGRDVQPPKRGRPHEQATQETEPGKMLI